MAALTDDERISVGLILLKKCNRAAIKASIKLCSAYPESDPQEPDELLHKKEFKFGLTTFHGRVTAEQSKFLHKHMGTKKEFMGAIFLLTSYLDEKVRHALLDIANGLTLKNDTRAAAIGVPLVPPDPTPPTVPMGCCTLDTGEQQPMGKGLCDGWQGKWVEGPCDKIKPPDPTE